MSRLNDKQKRRRGNDRDVRRCKLASMSKYDHRASIGPYRSCSTALPFFTLTVGDDQISLRAWLWLPKISRISLQ